MYNALGLMSGTSMDGIDIAFIKSDGEQYLEMGPSACHPYDEGLREELVDAMLWCQNQATEQVKKRTFQGLSQRLTGLHGHVVQKFLSQHNLNPSEIDLVGFHGQTLLHRPEEQFTLQIGDGRALSALLNIDVVNDFRSADVEAGGQGAPLVPVFHDALASHLGLGRPVVLLNLGGVGNITYIDENDRLLAFDTGPGSALIDDWMKTHFNCDYDEGGAIAASGQVDHRALKVLLTHPYFLRKPPKSLDRNDFNISCLKHLNPQDGAATLTAFTVQAVVQALRQLPKQPTKLIIMGGGRHNDTMLGQLSKELNISVINSDDLGLNGDAIEAQAFAYLAIRCKRETPITYPGTTGVAKPMTGGVLHAAS